MGDLESSRRKIQVWFCYRREGGKLREARGEGSGVRASQPRAGAGQNRGLVSRDNFLTPGSDLRPSAFLELLKESQSKAEKIPCNYPEECSGKAG